MNDNLLKLMQTEKSFKKVFSNLKNIFLAFGLSFLFLIFLVVSPNLKTIKLGVLKEGFVFVNFFKSVYLHLIGSRTFSIVTTILISILFGLNLVAFKEIRLKKEINKKTTSAATLSGLIFSILGAGCSACGILAVSFLSFFGMGALVSSLPFGGAEFDIAGVVLLFLSLILILSQPITKLNCKINYE